MEKKIINLQFGVLPITSEVEMRLDQLGFTPETLIDAIEEHKSDCSGNPSIYCGTYGKYSSEKGICGLWIDLTTFNDYEDFVNFCKAIHADEAEPKLMFQDFEGFPKEYVISLTTSTTKPTPVTYSCMISISTMDLYSITTKNVLL